MKSIEIYSPFELRHVLITRAAVRFIIKGCIPDWQDENRLPNKAEEMCSTVYLLLMAGF